MARRRKNGKRRRNVLGIDDAATRVASGVDSPIPDCLADTQGVSRKSDSDESERVSTCIGAFRADEKHASRNLRERGSRRCRTDCSSSVACATGGGTAVEVVRGGRGGGGGGHRVPFCPRGPRFTGSVLLASHLHLAKSGLTTDLLFLSVLFLFLFSSTTSKLLTVARYFLLPTFRRCYQASNRHKWYKIKSVLSSFLLSHSSTQPLFNCSYRDPLRVNGFLSGRDNSKAPG